MSDTPPAGWYPDPEDASGQRYWDGSAWTEHTAPGAPVAPVAAGSSWSSPGGAGSTVTAGQVNTWTWQSFVVTLLCGGTFISMIGILNAGKAEGALAAGDVAAAREFARRARNWTLGGLALGALFLVGVVVSVIALGATLATTLGSDCAGVDSSDGIQYAFCQAVCSEDPTAPQCEGFAG